jgi:hypothetical protein
MIPDDTLWRFLDKQLASVFNGLAVCARFAGIIWE